MEKFLIPDVVVQDRQHIQKPYPTEPVYLCVEIRSPEDKVGSLLAKCEEYHEWGVETAWVIDPETRHAWEYRRGQVPVEVPPDGFLTAPGISVSLAELFSVL